MTGAAPCWGIAHRIAPKARRPAHGGANAGPYAGSPRWVLGLRLTSGGKAGAKRDLERVEETAIASYKERSLSKEIWLGPLLGNNRSRLIERCAKLVSTGQAETILYLTASHP